MRTRQDKIPVGLARAVVGSYSHAAIELVGIEQISPDAEAFGQ